MLDASPLLHRRRLVAGLVFAVALTAAPGILRLELDNSPQGFFVDDDRELARHRELVAVFGRDKAVRVVASGKGLWSRRGLAWLGELEERLEELPGVITTAGLARRHAATVGGWPPADPAAFRAAAAADVVDRGAGWVSADGSLATILVPLARDPAGGTAATLAAVDALAATAPPGVETSVVGLPVAERALDGQAAAMMARFFPALALLLAAALGALFRRLRHVVAVVAVVAVVEVTTLGAMGWSGARLDVVTTLLVPLLAVVATAAAVHLLVRFRHLRERRLDAMAAALELVRQKARPVAWGGITTIAGFASLAVAPVPAVRALGIWAAFGFAWTTLVALTLLPCLLAGENTRQEPARRRWAARVHRLGRRWAAAAARRRRAVCAAFAVAALLAAAGALRLRPATDTLDLLAVDHPVRIDVAALEAAGIGAAAADLVLTLPRGAAGGFDQPESLERLAELSRRLRAQPLAWGVLSAGDLGPRRREDERLSRFLLSGDGRRARVALMLPMAGGGDPGELITAARREARALFPRAESFVTGSYPLVLAAQRSLLATMLRTFVVAVLLVALCLRFVLGGGALAARALAVNLWPVLVALGVMGWARVPVDSATVAVAAVALGLAVDDTLHTFADYCTDLHAGRRGPRRAIVAAVGRNAPAHVATALLLGGGFALFGLSGFVPGARFGLLTAAAIAAALVADLLLVPALLAGAAPAGQTSEDDRVRALKPETTRRADRAAPRRRRRGGPAPGG